MLKVSGLRTGYEGVEVVHGVDLAVMEAETVCVLGPNGAGKSTMLRAIMRQLPLWSGSVQFGTQQLGGAKAFVPAHHGMGYVPEGRGMLASLTVRENLEMGAYPRRAQSSFDSNLARVLALFPMLRSRLGDVAGNLSGGQAQMLAIGRALMSSPKLLLLDEPSLGLAPQVVNQVYQVLRQLKQAGQAILLVEQAVGKALAGRCDEIRNEKLLRDAYLGL
jgi:branched-chain amino acid transport system ATP-binding protein